MSLAESGLPGRRWKFGPIWLVAPTLAFLAVFFLFPMLRLLSLSIQETGGAQLTLAHYAHLGDNPVYWRILAITFRISILTALFSVLLGYPVARWIAGFPEDRRGKVLFLVLLPFWTSYLVKTFAWMIMLGNRGVFNSLFLGIGLTETPLPLMYNEFGVLVGMVHAMTPLAILTMLPVMSGIDQRLTQAADSLGAGRAQGFWMIYFPLSMPGVAAAGLLTFITSLGFFIVPAYLGGRGQTMLAQVIITQVQELVNWAFAAVLAAMMVATALIAIWIYDQFFGLSTLTAGSSGGVGRKRSAMLRRIGTGLLELMGRILGPLDRLGGQAERSPVLTRVYVWALLLFLIAPMVVVLPLAFTSASSLAFPPPGYSLRWFEQYLNSPIWVSATIRSFGVAFATAFCATVLGGFAALALARSGSRWNRLIFGLMLAPMIVPRIVIAVGLFYLMAQIGLVATNTGLVIGHTLLAIPYTFIAIGAVLKGYDWRLNQAAATLGAGQATILWRITLPLLRGGIISAALFAFVTSFDDLTIALFVSGGLKSTLPKQMWDDMYLQLNPTLAAVSVVVLTIVTLILFVAQRLTRK
ncbi:ABC transporter permease subunit [Paracoccus pantotrophus]|uniref:ABC transporter permease subunit n=1 Tax=Paracoccus pantotrophus TaxID=82367 RepID=A0A7H9BUZ9_PARPN|nr:ABC transporter permease subunit [Paracoccus pantotrophus]MDF3855823.1 ABC transporter permease subunit [Paracoccus pantotrophus]QLH15204.1 ABC transporter permease subunit [Paracoccus pantotrophus]RNI16261.1 ABC transporter permease subunit [Paracoccus pantotrophus]SFO82481.1 Binding-protein-dependent transport system inner membrane component [Paracoccus pantotrophus]